MRFETWRHFAHHRFGDEVKFLHALIHAPRQCPAVQGDDRVVRATALWNEWWHGVGLGLNHGFRNGREGDFADAACRYCGSDDASTS